MCLSAVGSLLAASLASGSGLVPQFKELTRRARIALTASRLDEVESIRRERWELLSSLAADEAGQGDAGTALSGAYSAICAVDGNARDVGLLNKLKYGEAITRLLEAWDRIQAESQGDDVLGEVACRLFEVVNQAQAFERDPTVGGTAPDVAVLRNILADALKNDPCAVAAEAMLQSITPHSEDEAFLRAEVRKEFTARQSRLVKLGHRLMPAADNEAANDPVLPWHSAVARQQAENIDFLLDDLTYAEPLNEDWPSTPIDAGNAVTPADLTQPVADLLKKEGLRKAGLGERGALLSALKGTNFLNPSYTIPAFYLKGSDSKGEPFECLYGRYLWMRGLAEDRTPCTVIAAPNDDGRWLGYVAAILLRVPTEAELTIDPILARKCELLAGASIRFEAQVEGNTFRLYDYPISQSQRLIQYSTEQLCVRDLTRFSRLLQKPSLKISELRAALRDSNHFQTSPRLAAILELLACFQSSPSTHPLALMLAPQISQVPADSIEGLKPELEKLLHGGQTGESLFSGASPTNPALVIAGPINSQVELNFYGKPGELRFLRIDGGRELDFLPAPESNLRIPGAAADLYMPLTLPAVPVSVVKGTRIGKAYVAILNRYGYTKEEDTTEELRKCFTNPTYIPPKVAKGLEADARDHRQKPRELFEDLLALEGVTPLSGEIVLAKAVESLRRRFGFRHLKTKRDTWVLNSEIFDAVDSAEGLPYDYRANDGTLLTSRQVYTWSDYTQLNANVIDDHTVKALLFAPCLPSLEFAVHRAGRPMVPPGMRSPSYHPGFASGAVARAGDLLEKTRGVASRYSNSPYVQSDKNAADDAARKQNAKAKVTALLGWLREGSTTSEVIRAWVPAWIDQSRALSRTRFGSDGEEAYVWLNFAHAAYTNMVVGCFDCFNAILLLSASLAELEALEREALPPGVDRDAYDKAVSDLRTQITELSEALESFGEPLFAIQLGQARDFALRGYYHRALVFYNDLISTVSSTSDLPGLAGFSRTVATGDTAIDITRRVESVCSNYELMLTLQLEAAAVLCAAGFPEDAAYIFDRVIADNHDYVQPLLQRIEGYLVSYGLRLTDRARDADSVIEKAASHAQEGRRHLAIADRPWRSPRLAQEDATVDWNRKMARLVDLFKLEADASVGADELTQAVEQELRSLIDVARGADAPDFLCWLHGKKVLAEGRPTAVLSSTNTNSQLILNAWPLAYSAGVGFWRDPGAALSGLDEGEIVSWITEDRDLRDPLESLTAHLLLAWYWSEVEGEGKNAWRTVMVMAEQAKLQSENAVPGSVEAYLGELNQMNALVVASGIDGQVRGLREVRTDFSGTLGIAIDLWERRWLADGHPGPQAAFQAERLMSMLQTVSENISVSRRASSHMRWFFPDYQFEYGSLPDFVSIRLLSLRREEAAADGKPIFQAMQPDERQAAMEDNFATFLDSLRLERGVDLDVLQLQTR